LRDFLRTELFEPLGMLDTSLGWQEGKEKRIAEVQLPPEMAGLDWNTPYWLGLGAPWAGMITGAADLARLCLMMLGGGKLGDGRVLCEGSVRAMTCNQLESLPLLPETDRRCRPWGLGWYLNGPGQPGGFSDLLGPRAYGHWGASGVGVWIDPDTESFCVLLTNRPKEDNERMLVRVSNAVAAAVT
jgi:CubicO group peptidase (beta-lactamase class C family)